MQFVVVSATLGLIYRQLRVQAAAHVVQSLSTIHTRWNSETMIRARQQVCSGWVAGRREFDGVAEYVAEFMEELGIYLRIHAIPAREMWEAQSWYIEHYYCMFKPGIEQVRQRYKDENLYTQFEALYELMDKLNRQQHSPHFKRDDEDITAFARSELAMADAFLKLRSGPRDVAQLDRSKELAPRP